MHGCLRPKDFFRVRKLFDEERDFTLSAFSHTKAFDRERIYSLEASAHLSKSLLSVCSPQISVTILENGHE